ncbi:MAG: heme ABC transporter ATP-binding protein [Parvibaculum sp.]|nr:heme ABC transporter ATP-binding protein [Parvibaculum sp.]
MIEAHGITVRAGNRALIKDISFNVMPGRITALLGPNGAGKSTMISVLSGERRPDEGSVLIDGVDLKLVKPLALARQRAVLLQNSTLDFAFTVAEVVGLGRLPFTASEQAADDEAALSDVRRIAGIEELWEQLYQTLSGGERQRVQFARALAQIWHRRGDETPRYLFLDEPTSALDLRHRRALLETARLLADSGIGVLAVLHDLNLAADYADEVVLLRHGEILSAGETKATLSEDNLSICFDLPVEVMVRPDGRSVILA